MQTISRQGWGAKPPKSRTPWNVSALEGVCQHWFGSPRAASSHAGCASLLRSVQASHMAPGGLGVPQGGSDIAYNFGVCPHGTAYTLRGWDTQTGANGTTDANRKFIAFVYMSGTGDPLTDAAKKTFQALYAEAFQRGVGKKAIGHGSITGSECPGSALRAWLASGAWKEPVAPEKVTSAKVEFGPWDARKSLNIAYDDSGSPHTWVKNHPGVFQKRGAPIIFRPK